MNQYTHIYRHIDEQTFTPMHTPIMFFFIPMPGACVSTHHTHARHRSGQPGDQCPLGSPPMGAGEPNHAAHPAWIMLGMKEGVPQPVTWTEPA